jgi:methionyl-tRNA synthetase
MSNRIYVTTAIPYVNGDPHLGHALELVEADVLARHRRLRGDEVRLLSGTDDNALKNVQAAEAEGIPVAELVSRNGARFTALAERLDVRFDDFIRTSRDPRHRPGVERLWRACAAAGDLYERDYEGFYCTGCEAFLDAAEPCPEHDREPERVLERNWFFRLSRYQEPLLDAIEEGRLRIEPEARRNEALGFVRGGLDDFSVSRSLARARAHPRSDVGKAGTSATGRLRRAYAAWGIPVPDDPRQVIYVWFDALANYVTALGYGDGGEAYRRWWAGSDERVHVIGKGILRFHAVYWPAILLSAGEPLPTTIAVHDYLTVDGRKVGKSLGNAVEPGALVEQYGADSFRWWLLREAPRGGDTDFREELLAARADAELANGLGNLVSRTVSLARRRRPDGVPAGGARPAEAAALGEALDCLGDRIDAALAIYDFRAAVAAIRAVVVEANRFASTARPWELARTGRDEELEAALGVLVEACGRIAEELRPFLPAAAGRIAAALRELDPALARTLFPRVTRAGGECP